jgi:hypothetical protein
VRATKPLFLSGSQLDVSPERHIGARWRSLEEGMLHGLWMIFGGFCVLLFFGMIWAGFLVLASWFLEGENGRRNTKDGPH